MGLAKVVQLLLAVVIPATIAASIIWWPGKPTPPAGQQATAAAPSATPPIAEAVAAASPAVAPPAPASGPELAPPAPIMATQDDAMPASPKPVMPSSAAAMAAAPSADRPQAAAAPPRQGEGSSARPPSATGSPGIASSGIASPGTESPDTKPSGTKPSGGTAAATGALAALPNLVPDAPVRPAVRDGATQPRAAAEAPTFDIVRVDPKGAAVMAGRAAPGATVTILDGGRPLGTATANARGEWVFLPSAPLAAGSHSLSLSASAVGKGGGGEGTRGEQVVVVAVERPSRGPGAAPASEPLVVLSSRGGEAASRPLQLPSGADQRAAQVEPAPHQVALASPRPSAAPTAPVAPGGPPSVDAIDYGDQGRVRFSGKSEPGATVRLYLDNKPLGEAVVGPDRNWQHSPPADIAPGKYELRVDRLTPDGKVAGRVAIPFQRTTLSAAELADGSVVVQPGNSLWRIARNEYGRGVRYTVIYRANRESIRNANLIYPGQVFTIPK